MAPPDVRWTLPENLRDELREPLGKLIRDEDFSEHIGDALSGPGKIVSVGDVTTLNLHRKGYMPDISIVDFKTKRSVRSEGAPLPSGTDTLELVVDNPPATITRELWETIADAYASDKKVRIVVEGEEDLAALPAIYLAPDGTAVLYGMPDQGVVVVVVDEEIKNRTGELINMMNRIDK